MSDQSRRNGSAFTQGKGVMAIPSSTAFLVRFPREVRAIVCGVDVGCRCRKITVRSVDAKYYVPVGRNNLSMVEVGKVELKLLEMGKKVG